MEKNAQFKWSVECQLAFDKLKSSLSNETSLYLANFDLPFRLACYASGVVIGAVLSQVAEKKERPRAFFSKVLTKQQRNWSVTERVMCSSNGMSNISSIFTKKTFRNNY